MIAARRGATPVYLSLESEDFVEVFAPLRTIERFFFFLREEGRERRRRG
jgi:hypothetical protein